MTILVRYNVWSLPKLLFVLYMKITTKQKLKSSTTWTTTASAVLMAMDGRHPDHYGSMRSRRSRNLLATTRTTEIKIIISLHLPSDKMGAETMTNVTEKPTTEKPTVSETKPANDPISNAIGEFGRWQCQLTILLSLLNIPCTWHIFALTFQAADQNFWCAPNDTLDHLSLPEWINISETFSRLVSLQEW